jgi:hypothetical protein
VSKPWRDVSGCVQMNFLGIRNIQKWAIALIQGSEVTFCTWKNVIIPWPHLSKISIIRISYPHSVPGSIEIVVTTLFLYDKGWRTTSCRFSAAACSLYSQLPSIAEGRSSVHNLRTHHALVTGTHLTCPFLTCHINFKYYPNLGFWKPLEYETKLRAYNVNFI